MNVASFIRRLHRNESGTISIVSVFAIFMFTILLAMVTNVAKHVDDKVRMQNAADAATYTGGVVVARGMNTLAFTNHLLCEVFALTAYMREGYARGDGGSASADAQNVEALVPEILDVWEEIGPIFKEHGASSGYGKFQRLGDAITAKVPLERELVQAWGRMTYLHAELTLPVLEYVLAGSESGSGTAPSDGGLIPRFQREVVRRIPGMADQAVNEIAARNGAATEDTHSGRTMAALLWRTDVRLVDGVSQDSVTERTLPAVDPCPLGPDFGQLGGDPQTYLQYAINSRRTWARRYLDDWINAWMGPYFGYGRPWPEERGRETAKMSQYRNLWRMACRRRLDELLTIEYPTTNLPHVLRGFDRPLDRNRLEAEYDFVGVAYWRHVDETFPGLFGNPVARDGNADSQTFAQATVFIPSRRFHPPPWGEWRWARDSLTGQLVRYWVDYYEGRPTEWNLFSQNWSVKLVPADTEALVSILQTPPPGQGYRVPNLGGANMNHIRDVNFH